VITYRYEVKNAREDLTDADGKQPAPGLEAGAYGCMRGCFVDENAYTRYPPGVWINTAIQYWLFGTGVSAEALFETWPGDIKPGQCSSTRVIPATYGYFFN
jgi:hypothetical protein